MTVSRRDLMAFAAAGAFASLAPEAKLAAEEQEAVKSFAEKAGLKY